MAAHYIKCLKSLSRLYDKDYIRVYDLYGTYPSFCRDVTWEHFFEVCRLPTIVKNPSTCVLAYLLPDRSRISKRKASGSRSGEFRSQIKYHVSQSELTTRCLLISLWKNSFLTKRRCIGEVSNLNKFYLKQDSWTHVYAPESRADSRL